MEKVRCGWSETQRQLSQGAGLSRRASPPYLSEIFVIM